MNRIDAIVEQLRQHGFRQGYETVAVRLLWHPDLPGLELRLGTIDLVVERDGQERYRAPLDRFDLGAVLRVTGLAR